MRLDASLADLYNLLFSSELEPDLQPDLLGQCSENLTQNFPLADIDKVTPSRVARLLCI